MELYARNITRDENQYHSLFTISMPVAFNVDILWDSPLLEITIKKKKSVSDFPPRQSVKSWALFHSELRKNAEGSGNKGSMFFCASYILLRQYDTMTQVGSVQVRIRVFCGPLCKHWHTLWLMHLVLQHQHTATAMWNLQGPYFQVVICAVYELSCRECSIVLVIGVIQ